LKTKFKFNLRIAPAKSAKRANFIDFKLNLQVFWFEGLSIITPFEIFFNKFKLG